MDDIGTVYFYKSLVLRAINNERKSTILELLGCGLIDRLIQEKLFPKTRVSSHQIDGHELVIEHEKIDSVTYPFEWSPEMLRQAGLCILKVNSIANEYGYELKDSHAYNVVFKYNQPMMVDFGSIVRKNDNYRWTAYVRFKCAYIYALKLYKIGANSVFRNLFLLSGKGIEEAEYLKIRFPIFRLLSDSTLVKFLKVWNFYRNSTSIPAHIFERKIKSRQLAKIINYFAKAEFFEFSKYKHAYIEKTLSNLSWTKETTWGTYHQRVGLSSATGEINLSERFKLILEIVEGLNVSTVMELAGNQGVLSRQIAKLPRINSVICSDYDENAIDRLFLNLKESENITPVVLDMMRSPIASRGLLSNMRLKSDLVIALAVTHHLILSQGYSLDFIFSSMVGYARSYLIIEFMPLGLYSKRGNSRPAIPEWYSEEWFVKTLAKYGTIIQRTLLEENRVVFVVKVNT